MDWYFFHLRSDDGDRVVAELEAQDLGFCVAFDGFIKMTTAHGWDQDQRLETLTEVGRSYQTYALEVRPSAPRLAMLTREIESTGTQDGYVYLGLTQAGNRSVVTAHVRTEACRAHGLTAPACTPNPQQPVGLRLLLLRRWDSGPFLRSFSSNSYGYSPQMIEKLASLSHSARDGHLSPTGCQRPPHAS